MCRKMAWKQYLPGAQSLICLIETLKSRNNYEMARQLEKLAEDQYLVVSKNCQIKTSFQCQRDNRVIKNEVRATICVFLKLI